MNSLAAFCQTGKTIINDENQRSVAEANRFLAPKSIKMSRNCCAPDFLLCSGGDLNPILGFYFPLFSMVFPEEFP
jgi:hypothetical protein